MTPCFLCRAKTAFGNHALAHLPFDLISSDSRKPFVVMDADAVNAGFKKILANAFRDADLSLGIAATEAADTDALESCFGYFTDRGYDSIIALGGSTAVTLAKALNLAVCLGPDVLRDPAGANRIRPPLNPLAYLPTGPGNGTETTGFLAFGDQTFPSHFLTPDLVVISPDLMLDADRSDILDAGLAGLAVCCESYALSGNPAARSYADLGISLTMETLFPLFREEFGSMLNRKTASQKRMAMAKLSHAIVISGYLRTNGPDLKTPDFQSVSGLAMALALPEILTGTADREWLGRLLLPLTGPDRYASVPAAQRPDAALRTIRDIFNELFRMTGGRTPRTLEEAGLGKGGLQ